MTDHIERREAHDADALDAIQDLARLPQAARHAARQIHLTEIACDDHTRAEAETREEHLHLLIRRILRLIEDDESILERTSAHIGKRRNLDDAARHEFLVHVEPEDILKRIVERAQIRIHLILQVAGEEA